MIASAKPTSKAESSCPPCPQPIFYAAKNIAELPMMLAHAPFEFARGQMMPTHIGMPTKATMVTK